MERNLNVVSKDKKLGVAKEINISHQDVLEEIETPDNALMSRR